MKIAALHFVPVTYCEVAVLIAVSVSTSADDGGTLMLTCKTILYQVDDVVAL